MTPKEQHINRIIKETESTSYLEIGYGDGHNFDKIECENKIAIDPELKLPKGSAGIKIEPGYVTKTNSDKFFEDNTQDIDCVFIDGDHTAEQVRKDIINALKCNPKAIILHDSLPKSKEMQEVPRKTKQFTGDVYKAVVGFIQEYPEVKVETYRSDFGLSVIYPEGKRVRKAFEAKDLTYEEFDKDKENLLNIID